MFFLKIIPASLAASAALLLALSASAAPRTLLVDANAKVAPATADGLTPATAFPTLQQAADQVRPGDTVVVSPGIYFESVQLRAAGTETAPITFKADKIARGRVIITGANAAIRNKQASWQRIDDALLLYSISTPTLTQPPSRVLYDGTDLFPYPSLDALKKFQLGTTSYYPGPAHGFAWDPDTKTLFVRLRADGKYGSSDPGEHLMAVAPINGVGGGPGLGINRPAHYNFGLLAEGAAHVVLDGFTFETPGVAGVYIAGPGHVTVRNSWFTGCRTGVAGRKFYYRDQDYAQMTNDVVVENCDYHNFPAFEDMRDVILAAQPPPDPAGPSMDQYIFWWHRKEALGYERTYESGIANSIGRDWTIRHNHIYETIDGLSCWATNCSDNLQVYGNRFERLIDNAVESENHATHLHIRGNVIVDVFEPFSWQPLNSTPWPGPVYVYDNVIFTTPAIRGLWKNAGRASGRAGYTPGVFKFGAKESNNWNLKRFPHMANVPKDIIKLEAPGILVWNNTIYSPGSNFLTRIGVKARYDDVLFTRNRIVVDDFDGTSGVNFQNTMRFTQNEALALAPINGPAGPEILARSGGHLVANEKKMGFSSIDRLDFSVGAPNDNALGERIRDALNARPSTPATTTSDLPSGALLAEQLSAGFPVGPVLSP